MRKITALISAMVMSGIMSAPASADVIKVGVIGTMSGPYALFGQNFKLGIDAWVAEHGSTIGDHQVEFVYRDEIGADPARAKAIAQELIVRDGVQYLAGIYFTPDAMAIAPLLEQSATPLVVMNAATSSIVEKSPLIVRTSFTMWQNAVPAAQVALARGVKKVAIAVSDYGPGVDAETAFKQTFEAGGGQVVEAIRMPLDVTDFTPTMQRISASGAEMIFTFLPAGPPTLAFVKAYVDNGLKQQNIQLMSTGDVVAEPDLPNIGDSGVGILSTYHYALSHESPENAAFLELLKKNGANLDQVTMTAVAAYDGARVIYKMIEATNGQRNAQAAVDAVKGMEWVSPRGPVSIDPDTRHITQNVYLREVTNVDGHLINKELETFEAQPDWALAKK